jgi:hypothetical protein
MYVKRKEQIINVCVDFYRERRIREIHGNNKITQIHKYTYTQLYTLNTTIFEMIIVTIFILVIYLATKTECERKKNVKVKKERKYDIRQLKKKQKKRRLN